LANKDTETAAIRLRDAKDYTQSHDEGVREMEEEIFLLMKELDLAREAQEEAIAEEEQDIETLYQFLTNF